MRVGLIHVLAAALIAAAPPLPRQPQEVASSAPAFAPRDLEEAARIAEAEMRRQGMPGMALVLASGDHILLARGFGREAASRDDPVTPQTRFMYNSISKQLVAAAVMKLAEAGRLAIDDPVSRHLPEWRHLPSDLRIRHLLGHTSGMRDEHVQPQLSALFERPGTRWDQYAEAARATPSDFPPGSRWSYANMNYLMLTLIVERATGQPLEAALQDLVLRPLGLSSVRLCPSPPGARRGEARGHVLRDGALVGHGPEPVHLFVGAGGFCGTPLDLARWTRALAAGRVVSPASYALMTAPAPLSGGGSADYGFALTLVRPDGVQRIGHGGYGGGFGAQAAYYPDFDLTVIVMANRFLYPERIERKVVRRLLGLAPPPYVAIPLSAEESRRFAGRFDVGVHGWHPRIEVREGSLWFALDTPRIEFPLIHLGAGAFAGADDVDGYRLAFSPDGRRLRLLGMGLMTWYGVRLDAAGSLPPAAAPPSSVPATAAARRR